MTWVSFSLDGRTVKVPEGWTLLDAAREHGISIPTLCHLAGTERFTSCMVCVVHEVTHDRLLPACSAPVEPGMRIETDTETVRNARRQALAFLLSEHIGDCEAPCRRACPAHMDIPRMIRLIRSGRMEEALTTVKADIALPAVLGRICPAPCEKACRRRVFDEAVAVCLLKRHAADVDLAREAPFRPDVAPPSGKRIAVIGAGPTGLAAAYYLAQAGHGCRIYDKQPDPGGMLRYGVPETQLPRSVLNAEIKSIADLGVEFQMDRTLGEDIRLESLRGEFDAVVLAVGSLEPEERGRLNLDHTPRGFAIDRKTFTTSLPGVFAGGNAVSPSRLAIRSAAHGKEIALSVGRYLELGSAAGPAPRFNSVMGKLQEGEIAEFMKEAESSERTVPEEGQSSGYSASEAVQEAGRCLGCDCRKPETCRLRSLADEYRVDPLPFPGESRTRFRKVVQHDLVVFEPGKCIRCGLCVRLTRKAGEHLGLTFVGRGFDVRVETPFQESWGRALEKAASECVAACPTAALSWKDRERSEHE
jgi:ferredoxin